jgi:transposase
MSQLTSLDVARIRYAYHREGFKKVRLQDAFDINANRLNNILENRLCPPPEQRYLTTPDHPSRSRKLSTEQRVLCAWYIIYGARQTELAEHFGVSEPTITRIKQHWTRPLLKPRDGRSTAPPSMGDRDRAAEIRYEHIQLGEKTGALVRRFRVTYSQVCRILQYRAFRPEIERRPTAALEALPAEHKLAKAAWLTIYGASTDHILASAELAPDEYATFIGTFTTNAKK